MEVHHHYLTDARRARLLEQAGEEKLGPGIIRLLVAIPSHPDPVAAVILGTSPREVLLLDTGGACGRSMEALRTWLEQLDPGWGRPALRLLPGDGNPLDIGEILPELERVIRTPARQVAYLITGGRSHQTGLLVRHAQVVGSHIVHLEPEYVPCAGGPDRPQPGTGRLMRIPEPEQVIRREALRDARRFLKNRAFDAAVAVLTGPLEQGLDGVGNPLFLTLKWVELWQQRDAMLFDEALATGEDISRRLRQLDRPTRALFKPLDDAVAIQTELCQELQSCGGSPRGEWRTRPRLPLIVEILVRADQERKAGRRNHAALLYYRVIELCLSERLRVAWGIDAGAELGEGKARFPSRRPEGAALPPDPAALAAAVAKLGGARDQAELGRKLGLQAMLTLLVALEDPALPGDRFELTGTVKNLAALRNQSIFAHGFQPVPEEKLELLSALVDSRDVASSLLQLVAVDGEKAFRELYYRHSRPHLSDDGSGVERGAAVMPWWDSG